ncbi:hypothetical protein RB195_024066 [Necator americanus]|uniref:Uncharacterized protein n=1 Tax=Necator americanus TaxID=51031 RepID=A0ABR1ELQ7_NECAM
MELFLLAKCPGFRSIGQSKKYGSVEEVSTEPGVLGLLSYILDALVRSSSRSSPRAQLGCGVVHHVHFLTKINVAGAFGCVHSVDHEWGFRGPSFTHEHLLLQIQLKTDASTFYRTRSVFVPHD